MPELSRGANAPVPDGPLDIAVAGALQGSVDLMVFQLGQDRRVRSDADFVFFNQPTSAEGAVRLVAGDRISVDLPQVPGAIDVLAVAVALDDGVGGSLAGIPALGVSVFGGGQSVQATATGFTSERAAVLVEIYRRQGGWKVRNVSAGWAAGLPALAREHGVSVDDSPPAAGHQPPAASHQAPTPVGASGVPDGLPSPYVTPGYPPAAAAPSHPPVAASPAHPAAALPSPAADLAFSPAAVRPGYGSEPPPPGQYGSWLPPGGSLPPYQNPPVPSQVGGYPPPGGDLPPYQPH